MPSFEWDEGKRRANFDKHGIDFADAAQLFAGFSLTVPDLRRDYGEARFRSLGIVKGRVAAVVHTERSSVIRIISLRWASQYETESYFAEIPGAP